MMKLRLPLTVVFSALLLVGISAQTKPATATPATSSEKGGSVSIEELYLSQEVEVQVLRAQAVSNSRETKMLALQNIRGMIEDKRVTGDSREIFTLLESLAGEGVFRVTREDGSVANYFPDVRREAVELIGKVGGKGAKAILQKVTLEDKEPMVLAEAVFAIGKISTADDKDLMPFIAKVMRRNNTRVSPDNNLAFSCLLTVERLAGKFKGIADPELINAILETASSGTYLKDVRQKAISVINKLRPSKA